ncbi:hypothetical protein GCM10027451_24070 [Geodermatophilus aquaeductus]|uniref:Uncharacterized protein n=1 Tax=Geodermatophilus aquaeductus TaxID=1564161 RepID=A0A521ABB6_9ACTN|nr:hypothetical protein SAMN06273567_10116 [Geodermatophilus aquaeductus]
MARRAAAGVRCAVAGVRRAACDPWDVGDGPVTKTVPHPAGGLSHRVPAGTVARRDLSET